MHHPAMIAWMKLPFSSTLVIILAFSLASCGLRNNEKEKLLDDTTQKNKILKRDIKAIGRVASVNEGAKFVLIKIAEQELAKKHTTYYIETKDHNAILTPTGERIGHFLAADITKGEARWGDPVFVLLKFTEQDENGGSPLTPLSSPSPFLDDQPISTDSLNTTDDENSTE